MLVYCDAYNVPRYQDYFHQFHSFLDFLRVYEEWRFYLALENKIVKRPLRDAGRELEFIKPATMDATNKN